MHPSSKPRPGSPCGHKDFGEAGEQEGSATFFHGHSPGRLQEPRWDMSEQNISQDGPQKAWLRMLCPILAQKLHSGS